MYNFRKTLRLDGAEFFDFILMPDTYFILALESEISQLKNIEDVLNLMEMTEPILGGKYFTLEAITNLCRIFLEKEKAIPHPTEYVWEDNSRFYVFDEELCKTVASAEWDDNLNASVPWSESDSWKNIQHNRMDLAGMIIDFAALCKQVSNEKNLYFLLSNEN